MVFSSATFLFYFLPLVLILHYILKNTTLRNIFLLVSSLIFYAWGESEYVLLMILSITINYFLGLWIDKKRDKGTLIIWLGVIINIGLLGYFKYFNFFIDNLMGLGFMETFEYKKVHLPIGISFFTFQSLSYLMDVRKGTAKVQRNLLDLGLYISLFPQLIAGPIIRYHDVATQIKNRIVTADGFIYGIRRFVIGLSKKLLIADPLALVAAEVFAIHPMDMAIPIAWLGIICYTLQIFFDFSGYSDMAIGIGRMLGFKFLENFNFPYISKSIQEFWRRWHISLSNWFRDYLYIPLGGNRKGNVRTYVNLIIVFLVTGIWHGAAWNFLIWGIYHGFFLIIERLGLKNFLKKLPNFLNHIYCLLVVMIGWVFFNARDLPYALGYIKTMFGWNNGWDYSPIINMDNYRTFILIAGIILSMPIFYWLDGKLKNYMKGYSLQRKRKILNTKGFLFNGVTMLLLFICIIEVASSSYSPFIYFRF